MKTKFNLEIKWAFIFIGSLLLWMVLERIAGLHDKHIDKHQYLTMLYVIPAIWIYVLALKDKKKNAYHGQMSFKQGFVFGFYVTLIVTLFSPLTQWIISTIITPEYFSNVIKYAVETGYSATLEDAEAEFNLKSYVFQSTIWALVMGVITTLIVAFFTKTKKEVNN